MRNLDTPRFSLVAKVAWTALTSQLPARWHWGLGTALLITLAAAQIALGFRIAAQTDHWGKDMRRLDSDQVSYIALALKSRGDWWPMRTDGAHNPLLPFLVRGMAGADVPQFFEAAKSFNVVLAALGTVAIGLWLLRKLPLVPALNLTGLAALAGLLPISTFFLGEALYYVLFFFAWMLMAETLRVPSSGRFCAAGALLGFAYLAKGSTLLLLSAFLAIMIFRVWIGWPDPRWKMSRMFVNGAVFAATAITLIAPRMFYAWQHYGDPFQNTAQYCFWMDSWDECLPRLSYFNHRKLSLLPEEERPSMKNYFRRHTLGDAAHRLGEGVSAQLRGFLLPENKLFLNRKWATPPRVLVRWRGVPILWFGALLLVFSIVVFKHEGMQFLEAEKWSSALFTMMLVIAHVLAFGWYSPIANGQRFLMAVYLPVLFLTAFGASHLAVQVGSRWPIAIVGGTHAVIAVMLTGRLAWLLAQSHFIELRGAI